MWRCSASEALVEALFEHATSPMFVFDRETLRFLAVNMEAVRCYGYDRATFLGMTILDIRPAEDRQAVQDDVGSPTGRIGPWRHRRASGELVDVEVHRAADFVLDGRPARLVTTRDVTEERRALAALTHNERRYRAVLETGSEALVFQRADGTILWASASARNVFGVSPEALVGRQGLTLVHPDDVAAVQAIRTASLARPFERLRCVARYSAGPTGEHRWMETARENRLGDPAVGAVVLRVRDVHEQVEAERERRELQARLAAADRLTSLGTLAAGVAHEINNPVGYALANVTWVQEQVAGEAPGDREEVAQALADARNGLERVREIVRGLSVFARGDRATLGPVSLRDVLDIACRLTADELRRRARVVRRDAEDGEVWVRGTAGKLTQVFVNLLLNAAHAIPEGAVAQHEVELSVRRDQEKVVVIVRDTGQGIAPEHLPRIFEPFFTTKPVGQGTGLGLAISHGIVRDHGGSIAVESTPGEGTRFEVRLAASPPPESVAP